MVSIIVPIYNAENYIEKCVESLLKQSFGDIEIILVDDGSKDSSGMKCDSYAEKDSRIKVIHQTNQGPSGARNHGIEQARGEWLMFVDADDYVEPEFVERLHQTAISASADIVMCNYILRTEQGQAISGGSYSTVPKKDSLDNIETLLLFEDKKYGTFFDVMWNKIYRASLFSDVRFPEGIALVEDICILPDLYYKARKISILSEKLYNYIYRKGSLSNGTYDREQDYKLRRFMMEQRLEKYKLWNVKELILLHYIHMYSYLSSFLDGRDATLKGIQKGFRKVFFKGNYTKCISMGRRSKFFLAAVSLRVYNHLVNAKIHEL